jgi:hypothetical protein
MKSELYNDSERFSVFIPEIWDGLNWRKLWWVSLFFGFLLSNDSSLAFYSKSWLITVEPTNASTCSRFFFRNFTQSQRVFHLVIIIFVTLHRQFLAKSFSRLGNCILCNQLRYSRDKSHNCFIMSDIASDQFGSMHATCNKENSVIKQKRKVLGCFFGNSGLQICCTISADPTDNNVIFFTFFGDIMKDCRRSLVLARCEERHRNRCQRHQLFSRYTSGACLLRRLEKRSADGDSPRQVHIVNDDTSVDGRAVAPKSKKLAHVHSLPVTNEIAASDSVGVACVDDNPSRCNGVVGEV